MTTPLQFPEDPTLHDASAEHPARKRENDERRRIEGELRDVNRHKDEFLATLAHELRGPLAPMRSSLQLLRTTDAPAEMLSVVVGVMERQVDHMVRLVEDLWDVSRISRGRVELRRERVDLGALVRSAVETCLPAIEAARHALDVEMPAEPCTLDADGTRITQILTNLLLNAAKYTAPEGRITLAVRSDEDTVVLRVRDTGDGIPTEMLEKVFDPFTQVDRTTTRGRGGLGIGLTLVRRLVEMHGGTVVARSGGVGRGTEMVVTLPRAQLVKRDNVRVAAAEPVGDFVRRILVVDDDPDATETMGLVLEGLGATVRTENDGPAAIHAVATFRPSVVLLDIGMPHMDGFEVARRVRDVPEGRGVTLVALTGWGRAEDREKTRAAGFQHHLVKPVDLGALKSLMSTLRPEPASPLV